MEIKLQKKRRGNFIGHICMITFLIIATTTLTATAQLDDPGDDPDAPSVPIDGGVGILFSLSVLYGAKKMKKLHVNKRGSSKNPPQKT